VGILLEKYTKLEVDSWKNMGRLKNVKGKA
jgi:hypothetical protein